MRLLSFPLLLAVFAASCATVPAPLPTPGPVPQLSEGLSFGTLVSGTLVATRTAEEASSLLPVMGSFPLGLQINASMLFSEGIDAWKFGREGTTVAVDAVRIRFVGELQSGRPGLQSGLLLLPHLKAPGQSLDWVVYSRGSEMRRDDVPSNMTNYEIDLMTLLASLGHAVWLPDYAGSGDSPGQQEYCLPASQAASILDGLAASRTWVRDNTTRTDTGRLRLMGYSQGGLATMAALKLAASHPERLGGLKLTDAYPMGAPLDLTIGYEKGLDGKLVLTHPHYTLLLVLSWAEAFPDQVRPADILQDDIVQKILPLIDGVHSNTFLHAEIARLRHKEVGTITIGDLFRPEYLAALARDPSQVPYYRLQHAARLNAWVPPESVRVTLAASPLDQLVSPLNSQSAYEFIRKASPEAPVRLLTLASPAHTLAGLEALVFAVMDLDRKTAAP